MRSSIALILLAVLVTFSAGSVQAQDAPNGTEAVNITNETIVEEVAPIEEAAAPAIETVEAVEVVEAVEEAPQAAASRYQQLSTYVEGAATVLGKDVAHEYQDVSQTVNTGTVFTRDAGVSSPAVKVGITRVGTAEDKYVQVTNQAVGSWDITGWTLASAENTTFTFPAMTLEEEASVRVHEGEGVGSATEIYTNSSAPLWIDNLVSLQDAEGNIISTYDVST
ncbi:MAG: lamin tail domain-containing protein, partial [Methanotrichaceae archaeon]|nr:lamin tail domain-containing protein [Methanotrichaceae archaeon]